MWAGPVFTAYAGRLPPLRHPVSSLARPRGDFVREFPDPSFQDSATPAGVSNSYGRTEPDVPAEDQHAIDAIAEAPTSPAVGADQPEQAAGAARPWPSVKQPTVRTDRF
jgi:hypothetical protein